jgi:hypothetical protein
MAQLICQLATLSAEIRAPAYKRQRAPKLAAACSQYLPSAHNDPLAVVLAPNANRIAKFHHHFPHAELWLVDESIHSLYLPKEHFCLLISEHPVHLIIQKKENVCQVIFYFFSTETGRSKAKAAYGTE